MTDGTPPSRKAALGEALRAIVLGRLAGLVVGPGLRLVAVVLLGFGAVFLSIGWLLGVKPFLEAREFAAFTGRAEGRIVESWLALEIDTARVGPGGHWRAAAKASPCAVVEYAGDWGAPARRAFCGNRLGFNESYTLHDLKWMAPGIPFAWARDASGFAVPEIRLAPEVRRWLSTAKPQESTRMGPPPPSALAQLALESDRPVDTAIESWASAPPAFPLALDPSSPAGAMPEAYVRDRRSAGGAGLMGLVFLAVGFGIWFRGTAVLLPALALPAHLFLAALPLLALPAWGDLVPRYLRHLSPEFAGVVGDMIGDLDRTTRLVASEPADALLADGEVLRWPVGGGAHAATFGRLRFGRPDPAPRDGDEVVASGAAFDTQREQLLVFGGGQSYAGNEIYAFNMAELKWFRLTEPSGLAGHDHVAHHGDFAAAPQRIAGDGGDNRLAAGFDVLPVARDEVGLVGVHVAKILHEGDVGTGGKRLRAAGQDNATDVFVDFEGCQCTADPVDDGIIQGIERFRAVDADQADLGVGFGQDDLAHVSSPENDCAGMSRAVRVDYRVSFGLGRRPPV